MRKLEEWIEFMEDETDLLTHSKLELLLEHSHEDQLVYENLTRLRRLVADSDPAVEIEAVLDNSQFLNSFYGKVMKGVIEIAKDRERSKRAARPRDRKPFPATCKS